MFGIVSLSGPVQALAIVAIVLVEALALYVGYGGLTRIAGPPVAAAIRDE